MIRVYKEETFEDIEIGKAKVIDVGFEITFFNGGKKHLLILEHNYIDVFSLNQDGTATFLGQAEVFSDADDTLVRFEIFNQDEKAFFQIHTNSFETRWRNHNHEGGLLAA